jgi:hypothetical protein
LSDTLEFRGIERRSRTRFPMKLYVQYRTFDHMVTSSGVSADLSSRGILVAGQPLPELSVGSHFEAIVEWPILLDGTIPLQLVAVGRVVRLGMSNFAASLERCELKRAPTSSPDHSCRFKLEGGHYVEH